MAHTGCFCCHISTAVVRCSGYSQSANSRTRFRSAEPRHMAKNYYRRADPALDCLSDSVVKTQLNFGGRSNHHRQFDKPARQGGGRKFTVTTAIQGILRLLEKCYLVLYVVWSVSLDIAMAGYACGCLPVRIFTTDCTGRRAAQTVTAARCHRTAHCRWYVEPFYLRTRGSVALRFIV